MSCSFHRTEAFCGPDASEGTQGKPEQDRQDRGLSCSSAPPLITFSRLQICTGFFHVLNSRAGKVFLW
jgi:hypothetical protein